MKFIEEDWEREHLKDEMFILEARKQMELEWQEYEEFINKKPALIKIINPLKQKRNAVRNKLTSLRRNHKERVQS